MSRTRAVRVLLAVLLVASVVAAFFSARGLRAREGGFLPDTGAGVIVVDMSASVGEIANQRTSAVFEDAINADKPTGLILFSDTAYELVPPRTPGSVLRPMLRFFHPRRLSAAERRRLRAGGALPSQGSFIRNPWQDDFRGGTRISAGLRLALAMLLRDHVHNGLVILVSDLAFAAADESNLTRELLAYKRAGTTLRIVPLFPTREDRALFGGMLGSRAFVNGKQLGVAEHHPGRKAHEHGALPYGLIAVSIIAIMLLAINELRCARLVVPRSLRP